MDQGISRREWLAQTPAVLRGGVVASMSPALLAAAKPQPAEPFRYCLNTSTISGQKLDLVEVIEIAARAGYQAIEPWVQELGAHVKGGGQLRELGKRISDRGLTVESAIGFFDWVVDDDVRRRNALEEVRRSMEMIHQIGGKRIAAPPAGATRQADFNLLKAAERYRALLEIGDKIGVVPQVELWGFSKALSRLGEVAFVAIESGHPQACLLLDVYHLYKGGSNLHGLRLLSGSSLHVLHFNDYPADPPRESINDAQRVFPGDGVAPLKGVLQDLRGIGYTGVLSLELFNRNYWKQDALTVARTGLEKMKAAVRASEI